MKLPPYFHDDKTYIKRSFMNIVLYTFYIRFANVLNTFYDRQDIKEI